MSVEGPSFEREPRLRSPGFAVLERPLRITEAYISGYWLKVDPSLTNIPNNKYQLIPFEDLRYSINEVNEANRRSKEAAANDAQFLEDYSEGVRGRMAQAVREADARYDAEHPQTITNLTLSGHRPISIDFKPTYPGLYSDDSFVLTRDNLGDFLRGMRREPPGIQRKTDKNSENFPIKDYPIKDKFGKYEYEEFNFSPKTTSLPAWQMGFAASVLRDGYLLKWLELPANNEGFDAFVEGMNEAPKPPAPRIDNIINFGEPSPTFANIFDTLLRSAGQRFGKILKDRQSPPRAV